MLPLTCTSCSSLFILTIFFLSNFSCMFLLFFSFLSLFYNIYSFNSFSFNIFNPSFHIVSLLPPWYCFFSLNSFISFLSLPFHSLTLHFFLFLPSLSLSFLSVYYFISVSSSLFLFNMLCFTFLSIPVFFFHFLSYNLYSFPFSFLTSASFHPLTSAVLSTSAADPLNCVDVIFAACVCLCEREKRQRDLM